MLSADGCIDDVVLPDDAVCCPPPLCGNELCCTFVAFFNLLPSGPMWDYWKEAAISYFLSDPEDPSQCPLIANPECPSLVLHAIYTVLKLRLMVSQGLWPALRESSPYTAVTTLDDHLARLQWEDCYNQHCRSVVLGELSPVEVWSECGPLFCEPDYPQELIDAVKRGVAIALTRAQMGVIKNLCGLNWIIAPLGAELVSSFTPCCDGPDPVPLYPEQTVPCVEVDDPPCNDCEPDVCTDPAFTIHPTGDFIEGVGTGDLCATLMPRPQVQAFWDQPCDRPAGLPDRVWPGVLAAECIVRSMLPPSCVTNITRGC